MIWLWLLPVFYTMLVLGEPVHDTFIHIAFARVILNRKVKAQCDHACTRRNNDVWIYLYAKVT